MRIINIPVGIVLIVMILAICDIFNYVCSEVVNLATRSSTVCFIQVHQQSEEDNKNLLLQTLNLTASRVETNLTELIWTPVNSTDVNEYLIYRINSSNTNGVFYIELQSVPEAALLGSTIETKFVDNDILPGNTYTYFIKYIDLEGVTRSTTGFVVVNNPIV